MRYIIKLEDGEISSPFTVYIFDTYSALKTTFLEISPACMQCGVTMGPGLQQLTKNPPA